MSLKRYDAKRDENEPPIVAALRSAGASVTLLSEPGVPDLLAGFRGVNVLLEVKMPAGKLTPKERVWHEGWQGAACIVRTVDDALQAIGAVDAPDEAAPEVEARFLIPSAYTFGPDTG